MLSIKARIRELPAGGPAVELVRDFSDECLNIFKLVLLVQNGEGKLRKLGVVFFDNDTLGSPFEKMKLFTDVLLLRNGLEWELVLVNQSMPYDVRKLATDILQQAIGG